MNKLAILALLASCTAPAFADECQSWGHKAYPVTMEACSNRDGGSGYYRITNNGTERAEVCWTVVSNNGRRNKGCHTLDAGETGDGSCFDCGSKNVGVEYILLEKYAVR